MTTTYIDLFQALHSDFESRNITGAEWAEIVADMSWGPGGLLATRAEWCLAVAYSEAVANGKYHSWAVCCAETAVAG